MTTQEIKLYLIKPKTGYIFHSLEMDDTYSDGIYTKDPSSLEGVWEEVPDPEYESTK